MWLKETTGKVGEAAVQSTAQSEAIHTMTVSFHVGISSDYLYDDPGRQV